jgi:hypothetical protein
VLPSVYWDLMLKGREWLARPARLVGERSRGEAPIAGSCTRLPPSLGAAS